MGQLKDNLSEFWNRIQGNLFPFLEEELPPISEKQQQFVTILEMIRIEEFIPFFCSGFRGRPLKCRSAIARAFIAKFVYNIQTTTMLIERLHSDISLRRICGWENRNVIPSESVFSRAFAEFSESDLPSKAHECLIKKFYQNEIVGHAITDSTAIEAREKPVKIDKKKVQIKQEHKGGRPKKGQQKIRKLITRIEKQAHGQMRLEEMLADLPRQCDKSGKMNAKGDMCWWIGYKMHLTVDDHGIPLAGITSSASVHDSQVAIPLAKLTAQRVVNLYDLMDSAYDAPSIIEHSIAMGHVPIIEKKAAAGEKIEKISEKHAQKIINFKPAEMRRYEARTTVERTFSRLKNEFCANFVRVRGGLKVHTHLMFGVLSLTADQLIKLLF
jgi:hypothetical protein